MEYKVGETYKSIMGVGKPYKIHILAIIEEDMIVYRYFGRHKQWWHYGIEHKHGLDIRIEGAN